MSEKVPSFEDGKGKTFDPLLAEQERELRGRYQPWETPKAPNSSDEDDESETPGTNE